MGTTADKLNGLRNTKQAIKQAIIDKGVAVDEAATFASYASKIGEIPTGGGEKGAPQITTYPDKQFTDVGSNAWLFNQIKSIDWTEFNKLGVTNMDSMFENWKGKTLDIANLLTTGVTNMRYMFSNCKSETLDLSNFNTDSINTDMDFMIDQCKNLKSITFPKKFKCFGSCKYMFRNNLNLTSLDLSSFDTRQVTNMESMFNYCNKLTSLDLSSFDTSQVTRMYGMFWNCHELESLNLSNFETSNVTSMGMMFGACVKLTSIILGNNWASNSAITEFDVSQCPLTHDSVLDLFNKLATRDNAPVVEIKGTSYDLMTPDELAIAQNKGWTVTRV